MPWRLTTNDGDINDRNRALQWFRQQNFIALGWGHVGDLNGHMLNDENYMENLYRETYGDSLGRNNYLNYLNSLCRRFYYEMAICDEVILVTKRRVCVVKVTGNYFFDESYPDSVDAQALEGYCHRRRAEYVGDASYADRLWETHDLEPGTNIFHALIRLVPGN